MEPPDGWPDTHSPYTWPGGGDRIRVRPGDGSALKVRFEKRDGDLVCIWDAVVRPGETFRGLTYDTLATAATARRAVPLEGLERRQARRQRE